jgi:YVTN family beta-propeller protein
MKYTMTQSTSLFVPMDVRAWLVNQGVLTPGVSKKLIRREEMVHSNLAQFDSPENRSLLQDPDPGVYVQWELPQGLRHGVHQALHDSVTFPCVPNRWLVVRMSGPTGQRTAAAWIVESDFLGSEGSATFPAPDFKPTLLGRKLPLAGWQETAAQNPAAYFKPLTAVSSGDITFTSYQPYHPNVFSIHDSLDGIEQDTLSYFVAGWYSVPNDDPLTLLQASIQAELLEAQKTNPHTTYADMLPDWLKKLQENYLWQIAGITVENSPAFETVIKNLQQTVCHGMVSGLTWDRQGPTPAASEINPAEIKLAVGHTALAALIALIKELSHSENPTLIPPAVLHAFQVGYLDQLAELDGDEILAQLLHQDEFNPVSGENIWEIIASNDGNAAAGDNPSGEEPVTSLPLAIIQQLNTLNYQQVTLDEQKRLLQTWQWELYALWWKLGKIKMSPVSHFINTDVRNELEGQLNTNPDKKNFFQRVQQQQQTVNQLTLQLEQNCRVLGETLAQLEGGYRLKSVPRDNFWQPSDPVVLMTGIKAPPQNVTFSVLTCRYADQHIHTINYPDHTGQSLNLDVAHFPISILDLTQLPATLTDLWQEFCLLETAIPQASSPLQASEASEVLPNFPLTPWTQPWQPLFMDWQILWHSIPFDAWRFDGERYHVESLPSDFSPQTLNGRTFLTPEASFAFKSQLVQFIDRHLELKERYPNLNIDELTQEIAGWDVLSQRLSGLHYQFVQRDVTLNRVPRAMDSAEQPFYDVIAAEAHHPPLPGALQTSPFALPPSFFQPVCHGQFTIKQLSIMDRFGQVIEATTNASPPYISDALKADPGFIAGGGISSDSIQFSPRIVQPARIHFDWVSAQDDSQTLTLHTEANPVCGWLLPNYLDQSLQVYAPNGYSLGELSLSENLLLWEPTPYSPYTSLQELIQPSFISLPSYAQLGAMLQALQSGGTAAYQKFWDAINDTFTYKLFSNERYSRDLCASMGWPLALLRTQWQFELAELPYQDQAWTNTPVLLQNLSQWVENTAVSLDQALTSSVTTRIPKTFPVRLGNPNLNRDGLIGYFQQKDYQQFQTVYSSNTQELPLSFRPAQATLTTLLVNPIAAIHAYSDILPVYVAKLPNRFMDSALHQLAVYFKIGPLLTLKYQIPIPTVRIPKPGLGGKWFWFERVQEQESSSYLTWQGFAVQGSDAIARFEDEAYELQDGWLNLSNALSTTQEMLIMNNNLLLTYALKSNSVEISQDDLTLELGINNTSDKPVYLQQLNITIPTGVISQDLTNDANSITLGAVPNDQWDFSFNSSNAIATLVSRAKPIEITTQGIIVKLSNIKVNREPGTCEIRLDELAGNTEQLDPLSNRQSGGIRITKFSANFSLESFQANEPTVYAGDGVVLTWQANLVKNMKLELYGTDLDEGIDVTNRHEPGSTQYSYTVQGLNETTVFTLKATIGTLGGPDKFYNSQYTVTVLQPKIIQLWVEPSMKTAANIGWVALGQKATLSWDTKAVAYCMLAKDNTWEGGDENHRLPARGSYSTRELSESVRYKFSAYTKKGVAVKEKDVTVNVYHSLGTSVTSPITTEPSTTIAAITALSTSDDNKLYVIENSQRVSDINIYTNGHLILSLTNLGSRFKNLISQPNLLCAVVEGTMASMGGGYSVVLSIFDPATGRRFLMKNIDNLGVNNQYALHPDGSKLYIATEIDHRNMSWEGKTGNVNVYEIKKLFNTTGSIVSDINTIYDNRHQMHLRDNTFSLGGLAIDQAGVIYVLNRSLNQLYIKTGEQKIVTVNVGNNPHSILIVGSKAYVSNEGDNSVSIIDISTYSVTRCDTGKGPRNLAAHPDGSKIYVVNFEDATISVINTSNNQRIGQLPIPNNDKPIGLAIAGDKLYVASSNQIYTLFANDSLIPFKNDSSAPSPSRLVTETNISAVPAAKNAGGFDKSQLFLDKTAGKKPDLYPSTDSLSPSPIKSLPKPGLESPIPSSSEKSAKTANILPMATTPSVVALKSHFSSKSAFFTQSSLPLQEGIKTFNQAISSLLEKHYPLTMTIEKNQFFIHFPFPSSSSSSTDSPSIHQKFLQQLKSYLIPLLTILNIKEINLLENTLAIRAGTNDKLPQLEQILIDSKLATSTQQTPSMANA